MLQKKFHIRTTLLLSIVIGSFIIGSIVGTIITYFLLDSTILLPVPDPQNETKFYQANVPVTKIIDGDTIIVHMQGKEITVKYFGIDAPENKGKDRVYYADEALAYNKQLVQNKNLKLVWQGKYLEFSKRLLAYVYVNNIFVQAELLKKGYAAIYRRNRQLQHRYYEYFLMLEQEARAERLGIWNNEKKADWEQKHGITDLIYPSQYIADNKTFHRPQCPKIEQIKIKYYYYVREKAIRDNKTPCKICKP